MSLEKGRIPVNALGRRGDERVREASAASVLVVDDDADIRSSIASLVRAKMPDWLVTEAATGEEAKAHLEAGAFDLLIADHYLPGRIDGAQLLRIARASWPAMPLVLLTGATDVRIAAQAVNDAHIDLYLPKPFDPEVFAGLMRDLVHTKRGGEKVFRGALR